MYFEPNRGDAAGSGATCGQRTLYTATFADGAFSAVAPMPGVATASSDDSQPFVTADRSQLYFSSVRAGGYGVYAATLDATGSASAIHEVVPAVTTGSVVDQLVLIGEASVVDVGDSEIVYMMCGVARDEHGSDTYHDADAIQLQPCSATRTPL